ncbi:phospholipase effector Tle1 domain-containing protein [Marinobacter sp. DUT-1]|uniref:phospholipase effector Tle1 domain-containing protein n=1 Tax=Marinobacter sp. DUT-1 TaxID=3412037 RepID=UPI003D17536F
MHIKPFYRLRLADLPLVENPFLASQTLRRTLSDPLSVHSSLILNDIPGILPGTPRETVHQHLISRVAAGELCLVHTGIGSDRPMSPVVSWRPDQGDGSSGVWHCESGAREIIGLKHSVSELNRKGLTPKDLSRAEGIGFRNYEGSPAESELNGGPQHENADRRLTLPLGASASVLPLATESKSPASEGEPDGVHLVAGLFTDGTLNNVDNIEIFRKRLMAECVGPIKADPSRLEECRNRLAMRMGESYANEPTNVVKLFDLYKEEDLKDRSKRTVTVKAYEPGAGTKSGEEDSLIGAATGLGETGVIEQVRRLFNEAARRILDATEGAKIQTLTVDLFGFSRGAAAARHATNEILKGRDGEMGMALIDEGIGWPDEVRIRFLGLFDTVAGIFNPSNFDLSAGNDRNSPVELYLDANKISHVVHLVAADEKRANFSLNSVKGEDGRLPENFVEITLPGAHSDVGGGYPDLQTEDLLLYPTLNVRGRETRWPRKTTEWDNLESLQSRVELEGWVGQHSLPLSDGREASIRIEQKRYEHPLPDGQVEMSLRMTRKIKGEYSRVGLYLMHELARGKGVPLDQMDSTDPAMNMPEELGALFESFSQQIGTGETEVSLHPEKTDWLRQRYIHHSDHYNPLEWLMAGEIAVLEIPAQEFIHPLRPALSRKRKVHPNTVSG